MGTYPQILAGMALTSALLQSMLPQQVLKASSQSVTSSTTLVNDTVLVLPVSANATYRFELEILYNGNSAGSSDLKFGWLLPSGASMNWGAAGQGTGLGPFFPVGTASSTFAYGTNGTGNPLSLTASGTLVTSSFGGNLQLQWAQNTSNATATTVQAGSILIARRIA